MEMPTMKARQLFAIFLALLAFAIIFLTISLATRDWIKHVDNGNSGLFEGCTKTKCSMDELYTTPGWKKAVAYLMIVVEMTVVIPFMIGIAMVIIPPDGRWKSYTERHLLPLRIMLSLSVSLGFLTLCIFAGYVNKYKDLDDAIYPLSGKLVSLKDSKFGYSYAFGWLGEILAVAGLIGLFFKREYEPQTLESVDNKA